MPILYKSKIRFLKTYSKINIKFQSTTTPLYFPIRPLMNRKICQSSLPASIPLPFIFRPAAGPPVIIQRRARARRPVTGWSLRRRLRHRESVYAKQTVKKKTTAWVLIFVPGACETIID